MTSLRALLRLEDKVAAEGRRLARIGGPPLGHVLPVLIVTAVVMHVAVLLLPAVRTGASLPAASPPQDFPLVWRMAPPSPPRVPPPVDTQATVRAGSGPQAPVARIAPGLGPVIEPVPEPSPELGAAFLSADVDALIPPPDAPPPSVEPGATSSTTSPAVTSPALVHRVPPVYPVAARSLRAEARVTIRLMLSADGSVNDASVIGCSRPGLGFETAALAAVKLWRYEPQRPPSGPRGVIVTVNFRRQEERP